jgi:hypothetical protein
MVSIYTYFGLLNDTSMHGREEKSEQGFDGKARRKETTRKTEA